MRQPRSTLAGILIMAVGGVGAVMKNFEPVKIAGTRPARNATGQATSMFPSYVSISEPGDVWPAPALAGEHAARL